MKNFQKMNENYPTFHPVLTALPHRFRFHEYARKHRSYRESMSTIPFQERLRTEDVNDYETLRAHTASTYDISLSLVIQHRPSTTTGTRSS